MTTKAIKAMLFVVLFLVAGTGFTVVLQLDAIRSGAYDPVRDDKKSPEQATSQQHRLKWVAIGSLITVTFAAICLLRLSRRVRK